MKIELNIKIVKTVMGATENSVRYIKKIQVKFVQETYN